MNKLSTIGLVTAAALLAAGCQSASKDEAAGVSPAPLAEPVEILGQRDGSDGDFPHAGVWLIRTQEDLEASKSATVGALGVDLSANDIVVISLGEQPTGGYGIAISAIQQVGDALYVQGKASTPAVDATVTEAVTHPWCAAVIANTTATNALSDIE